MANNKNTRDRRLRWWRRWAGYALGIAIETAAVVGISIIALLILLIVKVVMT